MKKHSFIDIFRDFMNNKKGTSPNREVPFLLPYGLTRISMKCRVESVFPCLRQQIKGLSVFDGSKAVRQKTIW